VECCTRRNLSPGRPTTVFGGVGVRPQAVDSTCGQSPESVELPRTPVEQSVGPEECRTFFEEPLAHVFGQGIELSHRSTSGSGRNGDRGSGRSEDPHCEATRGVDPVTGSAGSESLSGRGGRHPASSLEGLLVLIPPRGPHLASALESALPVPRRGPSPSRLAGGGAGPESPTVSVGESGNSRRSRFAGSGSGPRPQPVRRRGHGTRVIEGLGRR
jgi:hypothetical protein